MTLDEAVIVLNREMHLGCGLWDQVGGVVGSDFLEAEFAPAEALAIAEKYVGTGRCRTCRHWTEDQSPIPGKRVCALASSALGEPEHPETLAATWEGEDCYAVLITQAEFGCVQWERAEDQATGTART